MPNSRARLVFDSPAATRTCSAVTLAGTVASTDGRLGHAVLMRRRHSRVSASRSSFAGFWFPPEVIAVAVRWYVRYGLSYRDVEELMAERGIEVDHVTIYQWVQRFTPTADRRDTTLPARRINQGTTTPPCPEVQLCTLILPRWQRYQILSEQRSTT
jgi:hypothetical protein